jgi:hypothetical protein
MGAAEDIDLFDRSLKELVIKYEQYFLGMERRETIKLLEEVERLARRYTASAISNTMLLFRYNSLKSRLVSYRQYWNRTNRLIEEGKYSRDRFKMQRHQIEQAEFPTPSEQPREKPPESAADQVFRQYLEACRSCNLPTNGLTTEKIASTLEQYRSALPEKYRDSQVEFRVVVEGGKPKIKIRPS